ncbi:hypothetical protein O0L34_g3356 [Tuta absoluta]|nr:hypothetical protein O0L34_g3356 [Tuta absoluta]
MGRPKKENIWKYFQEQENKSIKCRFCDKIYKQKHVTKMTNHLLICVKAPLIIKKEIKDHQKICTITETNEGILQEIQPRATTPEDLTDLFSKALFISGAPMYMVEHPLWRTFYEKLNFKLPTRKALATKYLDKLYNEMLTALNKDLKESDFLHIQCDGWSNIRNEGIINFLISKPDIVFIKSLSTDENRHTSEYLAAEIEKVIKTYGENKFLVIIGDNARNLQKAFEQLKRKYPWLVQLNCAAHSLHLLCKDAVKIPVIKSTIDLVGDVVKSIKRSQILSALFTKIKKEKEISGPTLKLPCATRWGSQVSALKAMQVNKVALQTLAVHEDIQIQLSSETKAVILDDNFWTMVDQCVSILQPIADAIFKIEGNDYNINQIIMVFKDLISKLQFAFTSTSILESTDRDRLLTAAEQRSLQVIKPIHCAAHLLDPKALGLELNPSQETEAMEFIYNLANDLNLNCLTDLAQYRAREGLWGKLFTWEAAEQVDAVLWWKGICGSTALSKIALRILTAPCTSAATERSFSTQGFIHNIKRNRLLTERAAKIAFLSYNWNIKEKKENDCCLQTTIENVEDNEVSDVDQENWESEHETSLMEENIVDPQPSTSGTRNQEIEFVDVYNYSDDDDD